MSRTQNPIGLVMRLLLLSALVAFYGPTARSEGPCASTDASGLDWTDDIWGLAGGYPDNNTGVPGLCVELLPGADILLNIDVAIEGLFVAASANLRLNPGVAVGSLTIKPGGLGIIVEGEIQAAGAHALLLNNGPFQIIEQGKYRANPATGLGNSAALRAGNLTLETTIFGCVPGPELKISQAMTVEATGDFELKLENANVCPPPGSGAASLGGKTPPILKVQTTTSLSAQGRGATGNLPVALDIAGSFIMTGAAEVCVSCDLPDAVLPQQIVVGANFINKSKNPEYFDWKRGTLTLPAGVHTFEVGGDPSEGATFAGFGNRKPNPPEAFPHTNFSMDHIAIEGNVTFVNDHENTVGAAAFQEALYVRVLTLGPTAKAAAVGCQVFYCDLDDSTGTISEPEFVHVPNCPRRLGRPIPTVSAWGMVMLAALLLCVGTVLVRRRSPRAV